MWHKPCRTYNPWCLCIKTRCLFELIGPCLICPIAHCPHPPPPSPISLFPVFAPPPPYTHSHLSLPPPPPPISLVPQCNPCYPVLIGPSSQLPNAHCQYLPVCIITLNKPFESEKNLILPPPPPQLISLTHTYQVEKDSYVMQNPRNRICWFTKNVGQFINKIGLAPTRWCEQIYVVGLGLGLGLRLGVGLGVRGEGSGVEGSPGTKGMGGELVPNWGPMGCWS